MVRGRYRNNSMVSPPVIGAGIPFEGDPIEGGRLSESIRQWSQSAVIYLFPWYPAVYV